MKTVVIYQSKYGFTEVYARWIAEDLGADLFKVNQIKAADLKKYDIIIYGGGLYAGGVSGISLITKNFELIKEKSIYLFTVGAADVSDPENTTAIQNTLKKVLPSPVSNNIHIYHFRGGMCYSKMSFLHQGMMKMMMKMVRKKPESDLRAEDKMMLETYGQDSDFTDQQMIAPLLESIKFHTESK